MSGRLNAVLILTCLVFCPVESLLGQSANAQDEGASTSGYQYGIAFDWAASLAVLGEIAEQHGLYGVPGSQFDFRVFVRTPDRREWSLGLIGDRYDIGRELDRNTSYSFNYESISVMAGYREIFSGQHVRPVVGVAAGWLHYEAEANAIRFFTGEPNASSMTANAMVVSVLYGLEIPRNSFAVTPRLRVDVNFPDFGGGDGRSLLHTETDLGFKASFGIGLKLHDLF